MAQSLHVRAPTSSLLTWPCLWWLSPSSLQKHKEQRGSSTRMSGSCPGLGLGGSLAFNQVSILNELLFLTTPQNNTHYIIRKFFVESQNVSSKPVIQQLLRCQLCDLCHTKCRRAQVMPSRSFTERGEPQCQVPLTRRKVHTQGPGVMEKTSPEIQGHNTIQKIGSLLCGI